MVTVDQRLPFPGSSFARPPRSPPPPSQSCTATHKHNRSWLSGGLSTCCTPLRAPAEGRAHLLVTGLDQVLWDHVPVNSEQSVSVHSSSLLLPLNAAFLSHLEQRSFSEAAGSSSQTAESRSANQTPVHLHLSHSQLYTPRGLTHLGAALSPHLTRSIRASTVEKESSSSVSSVLTAYAAPGWMIMTRIKPATHSVRRPTPLNVY